VADQVREELTIADLGPVVDAVAQALRAESQVESIASLSGVGHARWPSGQAGAKERWIPVFEAALEGAPETLAFLLRNIRQDLGDQSRAKLAAALREVRISCIARVTRAAHPELGDQAEELLAASSVPEMTEAARNLRMTALGVRRLLMRPLLSETFLQLDPSIPDPEWRRLELADLAVDVVTAADYLLSLLVAPSFASTSLVLATEAGTDRGHGPSDDEALDRLTRRRLDARSSAVRRAMRLLAGLRRDVANV